MYRISGYQEELDRNFRAAYLIGGFIQQILSEEEEEELEQWILKSERNMQIFEDLTDESMVTEFMRWYHERDVEARLAEVKRKISFKKARKSFSFLKIAVAAVIIGILMFAGIYFIFNTPNTTDLPVAEKRKDGDIIPGGKTATLKLADGSIVDLKNVKDSVISRLVSIENGNIIYSGAGAEPEMHELIIPRKGFYQLDLPDKTKVWVNAESSIRYPTRFTGPERRVSVTGETYFEVARDAAHPFIVSVGDVDIQAIGTAFNINAYTNEEGIKTTLSEGKVRISRGGRTEKLEPGQQLLISKDAWYVKAVDVLPFTAWTRQQFKFKGSSIEEVMRMVERWYDARIIYKDKITDHFTGTIDRGVPVSLLLSILEATGRVHFNVVGNTITVSLK
ncbi:MAG: FecR domain-containing protein [Chitinophagales bacterium]|nr:FecR domain-containing protein [Chitinophagales bacterium]